MKVCTRCGISYPKTYKFCHLCSIEISDSGGAAAKTAELARLPLGSREGGTAHPLLLVLVLILIGALSLSAYFVLF